MPETPPESYNELLLRLYRLSYERPVEGFQDEALRLLKSVLPFESSMWGTAGTAGPGIDVHTLHLFEKSPEMMAEYEHVKHHDAAAAALFNCRRGTIGTHPTQGEMDPALLDVVQRYEQNNIFITSDHDLEKRFVHWISLFRADPDQLCEQRELQLLSQVAPHMMQALTINRVAHLNQLKATDKHTGGTALADQRGVIYHVDAEFAAMVGGEWPRWSGHVLPSVPLTLFQQGAERYVGATVVLSHRVEHGLLFLKCRRRCAADDLTPRELLVARLTAKGHTHKHIAKLLERSPDTVKTQLKSVYNKLQVSNVAELIAALQRAE